MASYKYQCRECGKTYVGLQLPARMSCNCTPAKQITGVRTSTLLSPDLLEVVNSSEAATRRARLCQRWQIPNKSHASHGANFSSNQKVVNLIQDIVAPVTGELRRSVRAAIITDFFYDIDTREMTDPFASLNPEQPRP
jgi:hypothetical protein